MQVEFGFDKKKNTLIEKNKIENLKKKYANNVLLKYKINIDSFRF